MKKYIYILVLLLFTPFLISLPIYNDGGAYAYMGTLFFYGKLPYIDGWDHKGISLYLINAFGYLIGFKNLMGIRILELVLLLFGFLFAFKTLSNKYSKIVVLVALSFGLFTLRYFFEGGNLTEEYGAIFALISVSLFLKKSPKTLDYCLIGVFFMLNFTIRANLISLWIAIFSVFTVKAILKQITVKQFLVPLVKIGTGAVLYSLLLLCYFLYTDSFLEFYNAAFGYNFSYSKLSFSKVLASIISSSRLYELSIIMVIAFIISVLLFFKKRSNLLVLLLLFWIPLELYFSNMSGKMYAHYYIMWVPIIILSIILIINYFNILDLKKEKIVVVLFVSGFLFFQIPIFSTLISYKKILSPKEKKTRLIANHIKNKYPDKSILVWGNKIALYGLIDKKATVPYFYQTFFKVDSDLTKKIIDDFTTKFKKNPPELLIDAKTSSLLFLDNINSAVISDVLKKNLKEYFNYVTKNYELKETFNGADFYIKVNNAK